ncbi:cell division protein FtsQ/DivIB [Sinomicrobium weinanense]|uniref:Cell division protein FtsQ/DivIB n=1 Tax=Sinomicrobium weinanense TaxID=2842200 RepID=A0A926Q4Q3_9FLAO|nr:cell division protein FtsQ/DivIB [Sinomicrobium weinanense]MBC9797140.1 cell division protein FtsQ/DivIB [Sinomicrobium weinanense]MBU3124841.1 cell division protein FtsQ/DivIB [Sinomicrobium weinanense]
MRKVIYIIKLFFVLIVLVFLYSFANQRHNKKTIRSVNIEFLDGDNLFVTYPMVNKLLIQNADSVTSIPKEKLVLNKLENILNSNEMIQEAQVYLTVNGQLGAKVKQREPLARVEGQDSFYIDREGKQMPLSHVHTARVPLITGKVDENALNEIYALVKYINEDRFLNRNIVGIHTTGSGYELKLRMDDFTVALGNTDNLEQKVVNFKAFYQKALKDGSLKNYKRVDLRFDDQVVCTKK